MLYNICKVSKEGLKAKGSKPKPSKSKSSTVKPSKAKPVKKLSRKQQLAANKTAATAATAAAEDKDKKAAEDKDKKAAEDKDKKAAEDKDKKAAEDKKAEQQRIAAEKQANGGYDSPEQAVSALQGSGYNTINDFNTAAIENGFDNAADFASKAAKYDFSATEFLADAKRNNFNNAKEYADAYAIAWQNNYYNPKHMRQSQAQQSAIVTAKAAPKLTATYYSNGFYITGGLNSLQNLNNNLSTVTNYQPSNNATVNSLRNALNTQPSWWNYDKSSWDALSIEEKTKNIIDVGSW
jgi:hypothetical protein